MTQYRCPLGRFQPNTTNPEELFKLKRTAWQQPRNERSLLVGPDDFQKLTAIEQQVIEKIGNKLYGSVINGR